MERGAPVLVKVGRAATIPCVFDREGVCSGPACGEAILWVQNPATGKFIPCDPPEDPDAAAELQPHWATCPDRDRFRRRKPEGGGADG